MKGKRKKEIGEGIEDLLIRLRTEKNWTYADVLMNINNKTLKEQDIKKWEVGLKYPDLDTIYELSELYQISADKIIQAKNNSFEKGLNSVNMILAKWICYFLNVSLHIGIVLMIVFYIFMFIFSLLFFSNKLSMVKKNMI